jgi:hypothetical protein
VSRAKAPQPHPGRLPLLLIIKYRFLAAANFEFIAIRIFEKERVVPGTVPLANLRSFELFPAGLAHEFCDSIYFFPGISPKRDACAIGFVVFVWTKAKELRRFAADRGIKGMESSTGLFVTESELWQKFSVKLYRGFHICHPQIDVIEATRFHLLIFNRLASQFNRW